MYVLPEHVDVSDNKQQLSISIGNAGHIYRTNIRYVDQLHKLQPGPRELQLHERKFHFVELEENSFDNILDMALIKS
jgi:hypothetical protein